MVENLPRPNRILRKDASTQELSERDHVGVNTSRRHLHRQFHSFVEACCNYTSSLCTSGFTSTDSQLRSTNHFSRDSMVENGQHESQEPKFFTGVTAHFVGPIHGIQRWLVDVLMSSERLLTTPTNAGL